MLNLKNNLLRKLIVLAAALLLVLVGISCNKKKPTETGNEIDLRRPDDKTNTVGTTDGMLTPDQFNRFTNEMINIRLLADSGFGAYYRAPVIITYGGTVGNRKSMAVFMEKRWGTGGVDDVGVDGNAKTDIVFMANGRGGDNLSYSSDTKVGSDPSASEGAQYSRASAVVFVHQNKTGISVVASAGTGNLGPVEGRGESEVKISKGTASGDTINFGGWEDLKIEYTNGHTVYKGSEAIREYAKKIDSKFNAFYTRWGQGKIDSADGNKWILPLKLMERKTDKSLGAQAVLVLYSEDAGTSWKFGPYMILGESAGYNEATGLSVSGTTVKLALVPRNPGSAIGIVSGTLEDCSTTPKAAFTSAGTSNFPDSYNNFEMHASSPTSYFINTRERSAMQYNSFIVNKKLTVAVLSGEADGLQENNSMLLSRVAGSGSVAVLADNTIVTFAEEAFAENSTVGENRYNLVQRRFTKDYLDSHQRINEGEEFFNPNLEPY